MHVLVLRDQTVTISDAELDAMFASIRQLYHQLPITFTFTVKRVGNIATVDPADFNAVASWVESNHKDWFKDTTLYLSNTGGYGWAQLGSTCNQKSVALSKPVTMVMAHELGHNLGMNDISSGETSIMYPGGSGPFIGGFSQRSINEFNAFIQSPQAACLKD
jgi:hypothetical protein